MKTKFAAAALIVVSGMFAASPSFAQITREQVKAELAAAILSGDIATGERSAKLNELYPGRYPTKQVQSTVTREQVKAELAEAIRNGDISDGERSAKLNELYPARYPAKQVQTSVTRAQVKSELAAALITGDFVVAGEESGLCNEVHPYMHAVN